MLKATLSINLIACTRFCTRSLWRLDQRRALGRRRVPHRGQQVLPAAQAPGVEAGPGRGVHQDLARVPRVRSAAEHPRAGRHRLQRGVRRPLEVAMAVGVRGGTGQQRRKVDDDALHPHVAVGGHQRRRLRTVERLVEGPGALARALAGRVPHPDEPGRSLEPPMRPAAARAEALDRHVRRGDDDGDGPGAARRRRSTSQGDHVGRGEELPLGVGLVEELRAEGEVHGGAAITGGGAPPAGGGGWLWRGPGGGEGPDEVGNDGPLGG